MSPLNNSVWLTCAKGAEARFKMNSLVDTVPTSAAAAVSARSMPSLRAGTEQAEQVTAWWNRCNVSKMQDVNLLSTGSGCDEFYLFIYLLYVYTVVFVEQQKCFYLLSNQYEIVSSFNM